MILMSKIPLATLKRIMKESGAARVSDDAVEALADALEEYAEETSRQAIKLANHAGRKTVTEDDVKLAL